MLFFSITITTHIQHTRAHTRAHTVSFKDEMNKMLEKANKKAETVQTKFKISSKGFVCPTHGGQFVHTSEMDTSYNASSCSNNMEPWSRGGNDVTVGFFLCQLNSLLLFKNQEAVELCCSLLSVCVST